MTHGNDVIRCGDRIVRKDQQANVVHIRRVQPCDVQHRWRSVGGNHTMPPLNEVTGQQTTPAAEFYHKTILLADRVE
jgi:hypothetical protein